MRRAWQSASSRGLTWFGVAICFTSFSTPVASGEELPLRPPISSELATLVPIQTPRDAAVHQAIASLQAGDNRAASRGFNLALQYDPNNSYLHFLNGLTYHLMANDGDRQQVAEAETGYLLALQYDPANALAAYQLGLLYLENHQYQRAQSLLAEAIVNGNNGPVTYEALAAASYYARDLKMALWSINKAKRLGSDRPGLFRTAALVETIAGNDGDASHDLDSYALTHPPAESVVGLKQRMTEFRAARLNVGIQLAQVTGPQIPMPAHAQGNPPPSAAPGGPHPGPLPAAGPGPALRSWFDCGGPPSAGIPGGSPAPSPQSAAAASEVADPPMSLPALPSPCKGAGAPRMGIVDVVYIVTDEEETTSQGVNLLDGLQTVLTGSISRMVTQGVVPTNPPFSNAISLALGNTTTAGINYSLNIANATYTHDEVIARPSLVAVDRTPSQFFAGGELSIALTGQYGGTVVEKPIGLTLSMTPTFIDDESMLMAVKVARSIFAPLTTGSGNFGQAIETSRNMTSVNVALKFDQTLIISGLSLKQDAANSNQVPVLGSIPGVQYLFGNAQTDNTRQSLIVLLTPRRPTYGEQLPPPANAEARLSLDELRNQIETGFKPPSNIGAIAHSLENNRFYLMARTGDLATERWIEPPSLEHTLLDVVRLLYF